MLIGAQVSQAGGLLAALRRAEEMGAEVIQVFAQSSRQWRMPERDEEGLHAYREAAAASRVVAATVCHAPYLLNVISPDPTTARRSYDSLVANLMVATALGSTALILHPGSHRGVKVASAVERAGRLCSAALEEAAGRSGRSCDLLFENTAGAGGTLGRSFTELAGLIEAAGGGQSFGICLDTQHLWASGISFSSPRLAGEVVTRLAAEVGLDRLRCLHLNDSKVPLGACVDRHENLGAGTIGLAPLRALLGQQALQGLPVILEVPGVGRGPRQEDLAIARALCASGAATRRSGVTNP